VSAEPVPVHVPADAPPPFSEQLTAEITPVEAAPVEAVDEDMERSIGQALNDVDLYSSYGLTPKAIDVLEGVLQRAPRHAAVLEKLLDLHIGAGNDRRTAELANTLEQIHRDAGDESKAERFGELRRRFQRAAGMKPEELAAAPSAEFAVPTVEAEPAPAVEAVPEVSAQPAAEAEVHEVDLSEEWAALSAQTTEAPSKVEAKPAEEPAPAPVEAAPVEEIAPAPPAPEPEVAPEPAPVEAAAEKEQVEYEIELTPAAPAEEKAAPKAAVPMSSSDFLADLASEVESLDIGPSAPRARAPQQAAPPPVAATPAVQSEAPGALSEVFEEFRAELGEMGDEVEDPETHYNLGIAYREMGLLEEAIGEFQKVAKSLQRGVPFRYAMQCCTLLGLCFMDKSQPAIAAMWYKKALETPGLDQESVLALRYDLGVSQEMGGDRKAALDSFNQVYAMNIDYRDVADRIATLQKAP
jgi:tetratricopeptide (TPR) repeat protein